MSEIFAIIAEPTQQMSAHRLPIILAQQLRKPYQGKGKKEWSSVAVISTELPGSFHITSIGLCRLASGNYSLLKIPQFNTFRDDTSGNNQTITTISMVTIEDKDIPLPTDKSLSISAFDNLIHSLWQNGYTGIVSHPLNGIKTLTQPKRLWQTTVLPGITIISSFFFSGLPAWQRIKEGVSEYQPGHILVLV